MPPRVWYFEISLQLLDYHETDICGSQRMNPIYFAYLTIYIKVFTTYDNTVAYWMDWYKALNRQSWCLEVWIQVTLLIQRLSLSTIDVCIFQWVVLIGLPRNLVHVCAYLRMNFHDFGELNVSSSSIISSKFQCIHYFGKKLNNRRTNDSSTDSAVLVHCVRCLLANVSMLN